MFQGQWLFSYQIRHGIGNRLISQYADQWKDVKKRFETKFSQRDSNG